MKLFLLNQHQKLCNFLHSPVSSSLLLTPRRAATEKKDS